MCFRTECGFLLTEGIALLISHVYTGKSLGYFMGGMVVVGVGWALNFVAASSLVTAVFVDPVQLRAAQIIMDVFVLGPMSFGECDCVGIGACTYMCVHARMCLQNGLCSPGTVAHFPCEHAN